MKRLFVVDELYKFCILRRSFTLQVDHHHLLLVLDLSEVFGLLFLLGQSRHHLVDSVVQQLLFLKDERNRLDM